MVTAASTASDLIAMETPHEREWVAHFVQYGGGTRDEAKAAYRRTYPHGFQEQKAVLTLLPPTPTDPSPAASPSPLPPAAPPPLTQIIPLRRKRKAPASANQLNLDLGTTEIDTLGTCLEQQVDAPMPDPAMEQELGFVISTMVFAALPHRAVKSGIYKRSDAMVTLTVMNDPDIGVPYGRYPRLLLAHICTLAKRTGERRILLGENQSDFIRRLNLDPRSVGKRSQAGMLKKSAIQLFTSSIRWRESGENKFNFKNIEVASQGSLIWTPHTNSGGLDSHKWQGFIDLSETFFNQCIQHSFPIDLNVIHSLRSSVAIDIYIWLTYKMNILKSPVKITWRQLKFQFGSEYSDDPIGIKNFKAKFSSQIKNVLEHYNANVHYTTEYLELKPSNTHIKKIK